MKPSSVSVTLAAGFLANLLAPLPLFAMPQASSPAVGTSSTGDTLGVTVLLLAMDMESSDLFLIDANTAVVSNIGSWIGLTGFMAGIDNHLDGYFYGAGNATGSLFRMNPANFLVEEVGSLGVVHEGGFAVGFNNEAWLTSQNVAPPYNLVKVDLETAATTIVGSHGSLDFSGLDVRSDGMLIGLESTTNALYTIDPDTATTTLLATIQGASVGGRAGLVISGDEGWFVTGGSGSGGSNRLFSFNPSTGQNQLIGTLTNAGQDAAGFSALAIQRTKFYSKYCSTATNSTGETAVIEATGSASSSAGDLVMRAYRIPDQFGVFFHAANPAFVPFGCSFLCAQGDIRRSEVVQASGGHAAFAYNNLGSNRSLGSFAGSHRHFQYWFRDPMNAANCGGFTFNLSDALTLQILP